MHLNDAHKTPQFWLIWWVLCLNVSAGIGVIGMASPMLQEIFGGNLIGQPGVKFNALTADQKVAIAAIAAGFAGLLSLFNIGGRVFWASLSDYHRPQEHLLLLLSCSASRSMRLAPTFAAMGSKMLFVAAFCVILSMYGGGFATVPAYLADMFGTQFVGAIHGRLLTAWSTAGIIGPVVVNYIREFQLAAGVPRDQLYNYTMYILCGMLIAGLICNYLIKPVDPKWYMSAEEVAKLQAASAKSDAAIQHGRSASAKAVWTLRAAAFWAFVGIPLAWGVWKTLESAARSLIVAPITAGCAPAKIARAPARVASIINQNNQSKKLPTEDSHASYFCSSRCLAPGRGQPRWRLGAVVKPGASCNDRESRVIRQAFANETNRRKAEGDEGQVACEQGQAQGLSQRGEAKGTGRRRPLVLYRGLHGQDLMRFGDGDQEKGARQRGLRAP